MEKLETGVGLAANPDGHGPRVGCLQVRTSDVAIAVASSKGCACVLRVDGVLQITGGEQAAEGVIRRGKWGRGRGVPRGEEEGGGRGGPHVEGRRGEGGGAWSPTPLGCFLVEALNVWRRVLHKLNGWAAVPELAATREGREGVPEKGRSVGVGCGGG